MKYIHLEMMKKYQNMADEEYKYGKEELQTEYMAKANAI